tara:strand:+ start:578 stop:778 length:201 start_codon:yes stop_codon:yes gene_type:complete
MSEIVNVSIDELIDGLYKMCSNDAKVDLKTIVFAIQVIKEQRANLKNFIDVLEIAKQSTYEWERLI